MKKNALLLAILLTASAVQGQEIVTEFHHQNGQYLNLQHVVEAVDNTLLMSCPVFDNNTHEDLGNIFYKVSFDGQILDSVFLPLGNVPLRTLFEPVPNEPGKYLFGRFEQDVADSCTYLRMTLFDSQLDVVSNIDVVVEDFLYDYIITSSDLFIDGNDDIIASYWCRQKFYMLRIGLDGTIKAHREVDGIPTSLWLQERHTGVISDEPLLYWYIGGDHLGNLASSILCYVIDTAFQVVDEHRFHRYGSGEFDNGWSEHIIPAFGDSFLFSSRFRTKMGPNSKEVVCLARFGMDFEAKAIRFFSEETMNPSPVWTAVMEDGTIYFSYMTDADNFNRLVLVCCDQDLNIRWQRYFLEPDAFHWATCMTVLSEGRIAVGSFAYMNSPGSISVVVVHDDYDAMEEQGVIVRPYAYWPNPARDELRLQYSPDAKPAQAELYDLQGRLVRQQRTGLETLSLEGLVPGTYTLCVTLEGGKTFSDKVVKE